MKKITLQVDGREMSFTEQELTAIVEKHLSSETTQQTTTAKVAHKPTENEWFEVKPRAIDQKLFEKKRSDVLQERTRKLILEAFNEMKYNPEKYGNNFKTMMPKKTWSSKTVAQLKAMASQIGDHNANWVEQAIEWAQRIANGESWEDLCNTKDTANWYRLVVWKNGFSRLVGGSVYINLYKPASDFNFEYFFDNIEVYDTIPLVVSYDK